MARCYIGSEIKHAKASGGMLIWRVLAHNQSYGTRNLQILVSSKLHAQVSVLATGSCIWKDVVVCP